MVSLPVESYSASQPSQNHGTPSSFILDSSNHTRGGAFPLTTAALSLPSQPHLTPTPAPQHPPPRLVSDGMVVGGSVNGGGATETGGCGEEGSEAAR